MAEKLDSSTVAHVAHLARLEVSETELALYAEQLSAILEYVERLGRVETTGITPVAQVTGLANVLADDGPGSDAVLREDFLSGAPAKQPPHLKVKAVLN